MTGGSTTTAAEWDHYRKLGAAGRMILVEAAAQKWNVPASSCHVEKGFVIHAATSRKASCFPATLWRFTQMALPKQRTGPVRIWDENNFSNGRAKLQWTLRERWEKTCLNGWSFFGADFATTMKHCWCCNAKKNLVF